MTFLFCLSFAANIILLFLVIHFVQSVRRYRVALMQEKAKRFRHVAAITCALGIAFVSRFLIDSENE